MKHVKFLPWVGNNYNSEGTSKRVMVLGESHYCAQPSDAIPEITRNAIWKAKNRTETYKAYTSFEKTFLGKVKVSDEEANQVWDSLLFYNYVQYPMPTRNTRPSIAQFRDAEVPFFQVINNYSPDSIIVWGSPLYNKLPQQGHQGPDLKVDGAQLETWVYTLSNGKEAKVMYMEHPSSRGFLWNEWNEKVRSFLMV